MMHLASKNDLIIIISHSNEILKKAETCQHQIDPLILLKWAFNDCVDEVGPLPFQSRRLWPIHVHNDYQTSLDPYCILY